MGFDLGVLAKIWHTMEIEVDGLAFETEHAPAEQRYADV